MTFDALHFPTSGPVSLVSQLVPYYNAFTDMLVQGGADTLAVYWYPCTLADAGLLARYRSVVAYARSKGLKIRFIAQPEPRGFSCSIYPNPPTTVQQVITTEESLMDFVVTNFRPDYYDIEEPATYEWHWNYDTGWDTFRFSTDEWAQIIGELASHGKSVSNMQIWVALAASSSNDLALVEKLKATPGLDAIVFDVYGWNALNAIPPMLRSVKASGKKSGILETWSYSDPNQDVLAVPAEESRFLVAAYSTNRRNANDCFLPWWSQRFATTTPVSNPTFFADLTNALSTKNYTSIFNTWKGLKVSLAPIALLALGVGGVALLAFLARRRRHTQERR